MPKKNSSSDYVVIASLFESENLNVSVAFKGEKTSDNFYILNEFFYDKNDLHFFKTLFSAFSSPNRPAEFADFFVTDDKFYAIFNYFEELGIKQRYKKELSIAAFDERCQILENILIKIYNISKISPEIAGCISEPENIKVSNEKDIYLNYNLKNIAKYKNIGLKELFVNIRSVIFTILQPECEARFNKQLHIVLDKCKTAVYSSIPELIIELQKAEKISKTSSWMSYIKYQISLRRPLINKATQWIMGIVIVFGAAYLVYSKLTEGQKAATTAAAVVIGDINYSGNAKDESGKKVSTENEDNQTSTKSLSKITLSEGLDMEYEDYIIQYGDTISSICTSYYKDSSYVTAVATFNGIDENAKLTAGTILKLPNRTAIALYISR